MSMAATAATASATALRTLLSRRRRREPGRVPPDDPRGEELALQRLPEVEELAQARVLGLHLREPIELLREALHALAQHGVLAPRMHQVGHALPAPGQAAADGGSGALERRHHLEEGPPERVGAARRAAAPHDQRCPDHEAEGYREEHAVATNVVQRLPGARPVLGRFAPCALPMPPDPVGRLERSRARPPSTLTVGWIVARGARFARRVTRWRRL